MEDLDYEEEIKERDIRGNESVKIIDPKSGIKISYSMSSRLKYNFDKKIIPSLLKKDKDCVLVVDGKEGSGKSTLAFQIAKYVDNNF